MGSRRIAAAAATTLALGAGLFTALPAQAATAPSAAAKACDRAPWQATVQGAPAGFTAGSPSGDYLWHDANGFHLRVTHAQHELKEYIGTITASAPMRMDKVRLEGSDVAHLSANHRTITFAFANHGYIDGIDFHTDCATTVEVAHLHIGSPNQPASKVFLGATKAHPKAVPFLVHRVPTKA